MGQESDREISINGPNVIGREDFDPNYIFSSRYTWYNFLPMNLFEQFSNVANIYFLFVGILQMIPQITTTGGLPSMYQALAFIVFVSMLRAGSEDYKRHKADRKTNGSEYDVLQASSFWGRVPSGKLRVGDIVRVRKNETVPADMILLGSSANKGQCFLDKSNLNGETCLEVLSSLLETRALCEEGRVSELRAKLKWEGPNDRFESFRGELTIAGVDVVTLDVKTFLMRETIVRNTEHIFGLVVYTGGDTKIERSNNKEGAQTLRYSRIMSQVNYYLVIMLVVQFLLCFAGAAYAVYWTATNKSAFYLRSENVSALEHGITAFFTWFIQMAQMVPISLLVSAEMVKFMQSVFIEWDIDLYHPELNKPATCNTSTLHDDLGQVDYIFSDKTGTLTQNKMAFRYLRTAADTEFGSMMTQIAVAVKKRQREVDDRQRAAAAGLPPPPPPARTPWTHLVAPFLSPPSDIEFAEGDEGEGEGNKKGALRTVCCCFDGKIGRWFANRFWNQQPNPFHADPYRYQLWEQQRADERERRKEELRRERARSGAHAALIDHDWSGPGSASLKDSHLPNLGTHSSLNSPESSTGTPNASSIVLVDEVAAPTVPDVSSGEFDTTQKQELLQALWGPAPDGIDEEDYAPVRALIRTSMVHMALSNTVKPYDMDGELCFQSESAEEKAMVEFARKLGFVKRSVNPTILEVSEWDRELSECVVREESYRHLATMGFSNKRARVSVVWQREGDGKILVMSKGQDIVMMPLITDLEARLEADLLMNLKGMCTNGLRTLVCAHATLDIEWWTTWRDRYQTAITMPETPEALLHSEGNCVPDQCCKCVVHNTFAEMETSAGLQYLGCVGMEDTLQPLVPEAIADFIEAGIKVWMITGDKLETAKNIGLACNLIDPDMETTIQEGETFQDCLKKFHQSRLIMVTGEWASTIQAGDKLDNLFLDLATDAGVVQKGDVMKLLEALDFNPAALEEAFSGSAEGIELSEFKQALQSAHLTMFDAVSHDIEVGIQRYYAIEDHLANPISLLVNRTAFQVMFPPKEEGQVVDEAAEEARETLRQKFFLLASVSKSVVFARAEPAMKKRMVTEIMDRVPSATALAVGDGANDVDMIKAAHVGVGISGSEGTAARTAADYAVGTFHMLHPLLLVHGYWSYRRIADLVNFIFYKTVLLALTGFYFGIYSGFSGQQYFNDPIYQFTNVIFTAFPVIVVAVMDKTLPRHTLQNNPTAFREAKGGVFRGKSFFGWILRASVHSVLCFFFPLYCLAPSINSIDGKADGLWYTSTVTFLCVALIPTFMILFTMTSITVIHLASIAVSIFTLYSVSFILNLVTFNPDLQGVLIRILVDPKPWMVILITVATPVILEFTWHVARRSLRPSFDMILQERLQRQNLERTRRLRTTSSETPEQARQRESGHTGGSYQHGESLIAASEYNAKWTGRKFKTTQTTLDAVASAALSELASSSDNTHSPDALRGELSQRLVRSMLRFRKLTGASFDSAARAQFQVHDKMTNNK